jgi:DNA-binding MarR family transcriptional regulator
MAARSTPSCRGPDPDVFASLDDVERRRQLAREAAVFTTTFGRWTDRRAGDGLSYAKLRLLDALHRDGPSIMRELGDELGVSARTMTALVDSLEESGLVARRPHPTDRRAVRVELVPGSERATEHLCEAGSEAVADVFAGLSTEEQCQLYTSLRSLVDAMQAGD